MNTEPINTGDLWINITTGKAVRIDFVVIAIPGTKKICFTELRDKTHHSEMEEQFRKNHKAFYLIEVARRRNRKRIDLTSEITEV